MAPPQRHRAPIGNVRVLAALAACLVAARGVAQEVPEVREVHVAESAVANYFPPGTPLRVMPLREFRALVRDARAAIDRTADEPAPLLLRATHRARWREGTLIGESTLDVNLPHAPAAIPLQPWGLAVATHQGPPYPFRTRADGQTVLWINTPGASVATVAWRQAARERSNGLVFELALPRSPLTRLELELPSGYEPIASSGQSFRREDSDSNNPTWVADGVEGVLLVGLRPESGRRAELVVEGSMRFDLAPEKDSWSVDLVVNGGPGSAGCLAIDLDPGLRLETATGAGLAGFSVDPGVSGSSRVVLRFDEHRSNRTALKLAGALHVPSDGRWSIPWVRPVDQTWIANRTAVVARPGRRVETVRAGSAVPVAATLDEVASAGPGTTLFVFENTRPGSPAELLLRSGGREPNAEVFGRLTINSSEAQIDVRARVQLRGAKPGVLTATLPAAWVPNDVQISALDETTSWSFESIADGRTQVRVELPAYIDTRSPLEVRLRAAMQDWRGGVLEAPRLSLPETAIVSETWTARCIPSFRLTPVEARGVVWVDPRVLPREDVGESAAGAALGWRVVGQAQPLRLVIEPRSPDDAAQVITLARVAGGRVNVDWYLRVKDPAARTLTVQDSRGQDAHARWEQWDDNRWKPLSEESATEQNRRQSDSTGYDLKLTDGANGEVRLLRTTWSTQLQDRLTIPRVTLTRPIAASDSIWVYSDPQSLPRLDCNGGHVRDAHFADATLRSALSEMRPQLTDLLAPLKAVAGGGWLSTNGEAVLLIEPLREASASGVVVEAELATSVPNYGPRTDVLTLHLASARPGSLEVGLPSGARLVDVQLDDKPIEAVVGSVAMIRVAAPAADHARLALTYQRGRPAGGTLIADFPVLSWPCLSSRWGVLTNPNFVISRTDGLEPPWWRAWDANATLPSATVVNARALGRASSDPARLPGTFEELLVLSDAGNPAVLLDTFALDFAGILPGTPLALQTEPRHRVDAALPNFGLGAYHNGRAIVVTRRLPAAKARDMAEWGDERNAIDEALVRGVDGSGRYASVSRWRSGAELAISKRAASRLDPSATLESMGSPGIATRRAVTTIDAGWKRRSGWLVAVGTLLLVVGASVLPSRARRYFAIVSIGAAALAITFWWPMAALWGAPTIVGLAGALSYTAGRARTIRTNPGRGPAQARAVITSATVTAIALALVFNGVVRASLQNRGDNTPIVVLVPFETVPLPDAEAGRAIVRLADVEQLSEAKQLAQLRRDAVRTTRHDGTGIVSARHTLAAAGDDTISVESDYEIDVTVPTGVDWTFPVGAFLRVDAQVDGRVAVIHLANDATIGRVRIDGAGLHHLTVKQRLPRKDTGARGVPVAAAAQAQVVDLLANPGANHADRPDDKYASVGPTTRVVFPFGDAQGAAFRASPSCEIRQLWSILPSHDRVLTRIRNSGPNAIELFRIAAPGWNCVADSSVDRAVLVTEPEQASEAGAWSVQVAPALPPGAEVAVELWRPATQTDAGVRRGPTISLAECLVARHVVAVRGVHEWPLQVVAPQDAAIDDVHAAETAWGQPFTDDLGPVSVYAQRGRMPPFSAKLSRPILSCKVQPSVWATLEEGRLAVRAEGRFTTPPNALIGPCEMTLPAELHVIDVSGPGLRTWTRLSPELLRLEFQQVEASDRVITMEGWIPARSRAGAPGWSTGGDLLVPWPIWRGEGWEMDHGLLTVAGPAELGIRLESRRGVRPNRTDAFANAEANRTLTVEPDARPGRMTWTEAPSKADVRVDSLLRFHPRAVEWLAEARYRVRSGPCTGMALEIPASWAEGLAVALPDHAGRWEVRRDGAQTRLFVKLDGEGWGEQRVVLRGVRAWDSAPVALPSLVPLGLGQVDTYVAWSDETSYHLQAEGTAGVQELDPERLSLVEASVPQRGQVRAYRVLRGDWAITVKGGEQTGQAPAVAATRLIEHDISVGRDGGLAGRTMLHVAGHPLGGVLVEVPEGARVVGARVDGKVVPARVSASGQAHVTLVASRTRVVEIWWTKLEREDPPVTSRALSLTVPSLAGYAGPVAVTARVPEDWQVSTNELGMAACSAVDLELARHEARVSTILDLATGLDRSSAIDRAALTSAMAEYHGALAQIRRTVAVDAVANQLARRDRDLKDALQALGIDRSSQGQDTPSAASNIADVRLFGRPTFFLGKPRGPQLNLIARQVEPPIPRWWARAIAIICVMALAAGYFASTRLAGSRLRPVLLACAAEAGAVAVAPSLPLAMLPLLAFFWGRRNAARGS